PLTARATPRGPAAPDRSGGAGAQLLESGRVPFEQRSSHRRVRLADVLEYERGSRQAQQTILDEMTRKSVEDGSADDDIGFMRTR
ncbi:hypothetical protein OOZ19_28875, partial [Saccharopolyspora sp. NFXS83]|nr:hypothetical protein [Saccharopolyspora sp. NFXS83]